MPNVNLLYQRLKCLVLQQFNSRTTAKEKSSESKGLRRRDDERDDVFKYQGPAVLENKELLDTSYISNVNSNSIMLSKVEFMKDYWSAPLVTLLSNLDNLQ